MRRFQLCVFHSPFFLSFSFFLAGKGNALSRFFIVILNSEEGEKRTVPLLLGHVMVEGSNLTAALFFFLF
jgi:hypothetical protein